MRTLDKHLDRFSRLQMLLAGIVTVLFLGVVDYMTGKEISFSIFYLVPVCLVGWYAGLIPGLLIALTAAVTWGIADVQAGQRYSHLAIPIWNSVMRLMIFAVVATVLTRLKAALHRETEARSVAMKATQEKTNFLANMSHEIRTPLNAVIGLSDVLAETPLSPEQRRYVGIFRTEGEHLRRLVNDILDISKLEAGRLNLEEDPFRLREVIDGVTQSLATRAQAKGLSLQCQVAPHLQDVWIGDPFRIRQILINLLVNAIKFTDNGEVRLQVEPNRCCHPGTLQFTIRDTGIGIPAEKQAGIFERYLQAHPATGREGGSGLGLSITRGLVERMGGRIWFESQPGQGTVFHFTLQLKPAGDAVAKALPRTGITELHKKLRIANGVRVLVVEDYPVNRMILTQFLKPPTFLVDIAENGKLALEKFQSSAYDAILMDMHMPEMDGFTATMRMREWEHKSGRSPTPIIALTASALEEERKKCLIAGCTRFLAKPVHKQELLYHLAEILGVSWPKPAPTEQPPANLIVRVDAEIADLVPGFLKEMRKTAQALRQAAENHDLSTVTSLAHKIAGAGSSYGFNQLSELGAAMKHAANENREADLLRLCLEMETCLQNPCIVYA